jgi:hypothetical protein
MTKVKNGNCTPLKFKRNRMCFKGRFKMKVLGLYIAVFFIFISAAACGKMEQKVEYYKNGSKKLVVDMKEGKPHGKTIGFFMNGKKEFQQEYRQGKKHGKLTRWYEGGQVSGEYYFVDDRPHGAIRIFFKDGEKSLEGQYKNGKRHGLWIRFYEKGSKKSEIEYKEGQLHGKWIEWDIQGRMTKNELYLEGFYERPQVRGDYLGQDKPGLIPEIFAPGIVSTDQYYEFGCTFSPDRKYFYFTRKDDLYDIASIYYMKQENGSGRWTAPQVAPFSGNYDDIEPMITPDGQWLFFGSDRPIGGKGEIKDTDIWYMEWTAGRWSEPRNAGASLNTSMREYYVSAANDGTIYFTGFGKGGGDIFQSRFRAGVFSPREPLPPVINTDAHESHPFIAPDGSFLIIESSPRVDRPDQRGLFISFRNTNNTWTSPQYMGRTINEDNGAGFPNLSPDGKFLFFFRDGDIYWVDSNVVGLLKSKKLPSMK